MLVLLSGGFAAGVVSQLGWPVLPWTPPLYVALVLLLVALFAASGAPLSCRLFMQQLAAASAGCALGIAYAAVHAQSVLEARLPVEMVGEEVVIDGTIIAVQQHADGGQLFRIGVLRVPWKQYEASWPGWQLRITSRLPVAALPGEQWRMTVRLKRPRAAQNPGVADFERYLLGERVIATGYLRDGGEWRRLRAATGWGALRLSLLEHALPLLGDGPGDLADGDDERFARAVLPALVLDERSLLSSSQWRVLADTGTAHLVAISGLHVALLWGALLWMAALILRRRPDTLRYRAAMVLPALAMAFAYAALAGMPLPALRATVMLTVASVFLVVGGQIPVWRVWLAAVAVVLVMDPLSVHASGFWLSFGAVAVLLLLNDLRFRSAQASTLPAWGVAAWQGMRMQTQLSLLLAPMLVALFGAASVSSVLANAPAIPLVNLLALPAALAGFCLAPVAPLVADPLLDFAGWVLAVLWFMLVVIDAVDAWAPLQAFGAGVTAVSIAAIALPVLIFAAAASLRVAALAMLVLAWPVALPVAHGVAQACVLDVGQGLAVFVRTAKHALLYDTGPAWGERDAGASVVVPVARALGATALDLLVVSHDDLDHAGGVASVLDALPAREVLVGDVRTLARTRSAGSVCSQRRDWWFDGVRVSLFPGVGDGHDNDKSCVMRVAASGGALLVPGDSTQRRELALLEMWGGELAADVLVAGHHGSRTSSSATFLHQVAPQSVVFSAAHGNRFGHPHASVVERVRRHGLSQQITGVGGAVCFALSPDGAPKPQGWRAVTHRFWRE